MNKKFLFLTTLFLFGIFTTWAQQSKIIDKFKLEDYTIRVVFYDPYLNLIEQNPSFKDLDSTSQSDIWEKYLLNNIIYDFQLIKKKKILKHYIVKGNPTKTINKNNLTRNTIFQLDIVKHSDELNYYQHLSYQNEKILTIGMMPCYETLFESMQLIQDEYKAGRKYNSYNFFGRYRMLIPYMLIQQGAIFFITKDLYGQIPTKLIARDNSIYENNFFDYQESLKNYFQIDRSEKIRVQNYNPNGILVDESPTLRISTDIMSNINDTSNISGVTTLPFFLKSDSAYLIKQTDSTKVFRIETPNNASINKYFQNIVVTKDLKNEILKIEANQLLHIYSIGGNSVSKRNFILYFKKFNDCILPYKILASEIDDKNFTKPRVIIELDYVFHKK